MDARLIKFLILSQLLWGSIWTEAKSERNCPYIPTVEDTDNFTRRLFVPIKRLHLALTDGRTLTVELRERNIDLLNLSGLGRGIEFRLNEPALVEVVEAHLETFANGQSGVETASGPLCHLKIPHFIDLVFTQPVYIRPNEAHLLKIGMKASEWLSFKATGTPCKPQQLKCDLVSESGNASIVALRDEF